MDYMLEMLDMEHSGFENNTMTVFDLFGEDVDYLVPPEEFTLELDASKFIKEFEEELDAIVENAPQEIDDEEKIHQKKVRQYLKAWLKKHKHSPIPTRSEKLMLCEKLNITIKYLDNFMRNHRYRAITKGRFSRTKKSSQYKRCQDDEL